MGHTTTQNTNIWEGKYVGFNLDAFGENDEYFSTTGDYQTKRSSAGVQGLSASSFKREDGISLIEMFDVGILGMPTITAFIDMATAPTAALDTIAYRIANSKVPKTHIGSPLPGGTPFSGGTEGIINSYSINSYFHSGKYVGIQSIADVFTIFSDNFKLLGTSLSSISSSASTDITSLTGRVTSLEDLLGTAGEEETDTIINRYNEIKNWFNGVQETESGAALISTVATINDNYISNIESGPALDQQHPVAPVIVANNTAHIFGSNITLSHTTNTTNTGNNSAPVRPTTWPSESGSTTTANLSVNIDYLDSGNPVSTTVNLYGRTLNDAFAEVLDKMKLISDNAIYSVNNFTDNKVVLTADDIVLSYNSPRGSNTSYGYEQIVYYNSYGGQTVKTDTAETTIASRFKTITTAINTISEVDYQRDQWLVL